MKRPKTIFFLLLPLLADMFSCTTRKSTDEEKIREQLKNYYATMSARDWSRYRTFFWPQATITTAWLKPGNHSASVSIITIDEFINQTPQGPDSQPIFEEKLLESEIEIKNNLAVVWARYSVKFGSDTKLKEWSGVDLFSLLFNDNEWRIVSLTFQTQ